MAPPPVGVLAAAAAAVAAGGVAWWAHGRAARDRGTSGSGGRPPHPGVLLDGAMYSRLVEPMERALHNKIVRVVEPRGKRILDACSGTGQLSLLLADAGARQVVGVELSRSSHQRASERAAQRDRVLAASATVSDASAMSPAAGALSFLLGDAATATASEQDGAFDVAVVCLALHEMPTQYRVPVLRELARVAQKVVVVDFCTPFPKFTLQGITILAVEFVAGYTHFTSMLDFQRRGGVLALADEAGCTATVLPSRPAAIWAVELRRRL